MSGVAVTPAAPAQSHTAPFVHRAPLDGLRAVAALLVLLFHAGTPWFDHGYTGVDVFFVLSGFLITSLLIRELRDSGRLRFVAFYVRRVRRLLPAALLVLLVTAALYELLASPAAVAEARGGFVAAAAYFANWYFLGQSHDYFAQEAHPSPVVHYWSLSVEEQFYLVWPVLLLGLVLLVRRSGLRLDVVVAGLAAAGLFYAGLVAHGDPMGSYYGTGSRAYQLLLGATAALICFRQERSRRSQRQAPRSAAGASSLPSASSSSWAPAPRSSPVTPPSGTVSPRLQERRSSSTGSSTCPLPGRRGCSRGGLRAPSVPGRTPRTCGTGR